MIIIAINEKHSYFKGKNRTEEVQKLVRGEIADLLCAGEMSTGCHSKYDTDGYMLYKVSASEDAFKE